MPIAVSSGVLGEKAKAVLLPALREASNDEDPMIRSDAAGTLRALERFERSREKAGSH